ncbi:MAG: N(G),N(G)-dimethylarginine dimethylaminohydrolase [Desulfobacula sp.]|nr:N(G),N(G)-dimethylarginine dimethylaminohydrolase [Desulfobacula sp.]
MFTRAIVKTPCKNMVKGITTANLGQPDYKLALKQHKNYIQALELCGLKVTVLDPDETFPDSTFIEDTCLVTPRCAIITNPGADSRKKEIISVCKAVKELGMKVEHIQDPGTVDAGDIMMVQNHYYAGLSERTNMEGALQLKNILTKYKFTSSTIKLEKVLHLKTGISYLENNNLLACGEFLTKPELKDFNSLKVDSNESYAANSVWINDKVLVPQGFVKTSAMIENRGYKIIEVDVSEFRKLDGGLSCLSLRF